MSTGWENHEPAPLEFFHGRVMDAFHELRRAKGENPERTLTISGSEFSDLIARIKIETYNKYPNQVSSAAIPKGDI